MPYSTAGAGACQQSNDGYNLRRSVLAQREFPVSPLVGVGAVVVDEQGRVLLVKRATEPMKGRWSLPGGLLELGESLVDGVRREVAEETGLNVRPEAIVEVVDRIYLEDVPYNTNERPRVRYHYVIVDFWCTVIDQEAGAALAASDAEEIRWATRAEWNRSNSINVYDLETVTVEVIEKGWQMAHAAGVHG
jgi:8-oxo-dGTP diphosphatase